MACLQDTPGGTSRPERIIGPLLPFSELDEVEKPDKDHVPRTVRIPNEIDLEARKLHKPPILMHVTNRRKGPPKYRPSNMVVFWLLLSSSAARLKTVTYSTMPICRKRLAHQRPPKVIKV